MNQEFKELQSIRIRKLKKNQQLKNLRLRALSKPLDAPYIAKNPTNQQLENLHPILINQDATIEQVLQAIDQLLRGQEFDPLLLIKAIRIQGCKHLNGPQFSEQLYLEYPLIMRFLIDHLKSTHRETLYETTWIFINLTYSEKELPSALLVDKPFMQTITDLLKSEVPSIRNQVLWILSNIFTSDNVEHYRHQFLKDTNVIEVIMEFVDDEEAVYDYLVNCFQTLETLLCPFKSFTLREQDLIKERAASIARSIAHYVFKNDITIVPIVLALFQSLSERDPEGVAYALLKEGALARIIMQCLDVENQSVLVHSIYTLANCLSCDHQKIIVPLVRDLRLLTKVKNLLIKHNQNQNIKWALLFLSSNVPIKNTAVLDLFSEEVLELVLSTLGDNSLKLRIEAVTTLHYYLLVCSRRHIRQAVELKALEGLRQQMHFTDPRILLLTLQCLEVILQAGQKDVQEGRTATNQYWQEFVEMTGEAKLEEILQLDIETVYNKAASILKSYQDQEPEQVAHNEERIDI